MMAHALLLAWHGTAAAAQFGPQHAQHVPATPLCAPQQGPCKRLNLQHTCSHNTAQHSTTPRTWG